MTFPWTNSLRSAAVGLLFAACVILSRTINFLDGYAAIAITTVILLALPTSRALSRRILLLGAIAAGVSPLLWITSVPSWGLGRTHLLLALIAGTLAAWVTWDPAARLRRLMPELRWIDTVPLAVGVGATFLNSPWLRVREPNDALSMLQAGWDNSAHFSMTRMIRLFGHTYEAAAPLSTGENLKFTEYPQGFHSLAATIMELLVGAKPGTVTNEIVAFTHAVGIVAIGATILVASAICSLPALRRRPAVALPTAALSVAFFLLGPGSRLTENGFINFYLACALCVAIISIAMQMPKVPMPLHLGALLAALVGVTYGWVLLLAFALPAALLVLIPLRRAHWRAPRISWVWCSALITVAVLLALRAANALMQLRAEDVLLTTGGFETISLLLTGLLAATAAFTSLAVLADRPFHEWITSRWTWLASVPAVGTCTALAIAYLQWSENSTLTYYFWKFSCGLLLMSGVIATISTAHLVTRALQTPTFAGATRTKWLISGFLTLVCSQIFGLTAIGVSPDGFVGMNVSRSPGWSARSALIERATHPLALNADLLGAATTATTNPDARFLTVLPKGIGLLHPVASAQWVLALSGTWTAEANEASRPLIDMDTTTESILATIDILLAESPRTVVLTDPETMAAYHESGRTEEQVLRVRTW